MRRYGISLYHSSKWAIERFFETMVPEIAPFNIEVTLVEPGGGRTQFGQGSMAVGPPLEAYETAPFSGRQKVLAEGTHKPIGDPDNMVRAMIDSL